MKYVVLAQYEIEPSYSTIEAAQEEVKKLISRSQSNYFIAQIVEGYKVTIPYTVETLQADDVQKLITKGCGCSQTTSN